MTQEYGALRHLSCQGGQVRRNMVATGFKLGTFVRLFGEEKREIGHDRGRR